MQQLIKQVQDWANERGLNKPEQAPVQILKVVSELGELCDAIAKKEKNGNADIIDGFGDVVVTLIVLCEMTGEQFLHYSANECSVMDDIGYLDFATYDISSMVKCIRYGDSLSEDIRTFMHLLKGWTKLHGLSIEQCLQAAYNEIKNRTGVLVNGTFIKDEVQSVATETGVDLGTLKVGDSVEFRDGEIEEVLTIKLDEQSPEPYKLSGEHFSASYTKNGDWAWNGSPHDNDIVAIHKA